VVERRSLTCLHVFIQSWRPLANYVVKAGVVCLQVKLCDPYLSALDVRLSRRGAIQIYVCLYGTTRIGVDRAHTPSPDNFCFYLLIQLVYILVIIPRSCINRCVILHVLLVHTVVVQSTYGMHMHCSIM